MWTLFFLAAPRPWGAVYESHAAAAKAGKYYEKQAAARHGAESLGLSFVLQPTVGVDRELIRPKRKLFLTPDQVACIRNGFKAVSLYCQSLSDYLRAHNLKGVFVPDGQGKNGFCEAELKALANVPGAGFRLWLSVADDDFFVSSSIVVRGVNIGNASDAWAAVNPCDYINVE
jgi:hypothetical protein